MSRRLVTAVPVIVPAAYSSGDAIGGLLTFEDACSVFEPDFRIVSAVLIDNAKQGVHVALLLFDRTFTPTADNAAMDPSDSDLQNATAIVDFPAADYLALNDNSICQPDLGAGVPGRLVDGGTDLYGQLISYGTPTYVAASDITIKLLIEG